MTAMPTSSSAPTTMPTQRRPERCRLCGCSERPRAFPPRCRAFRPQRPQRLQDQRRGSGRLCRLQRCRGRRCNGDGLDDVVVGAVYADSKAGASLWCSARPRAFPPTSTFRPQRPQWLQDRRHHGGRPERLGVRRPERLSVAGAGISMVTVLPMSSSALPLPVPTAPTAALPMWCSARPEGPLPKSSSPSRRRQRFSDQRRGGARLCRQVRVGGRRHQWRWFRRYHRRRPDVSTQASSTAPAMPSSYGWARR